MFAVLVLRLKVFYKVVIMVTDGEAVSKCIENAS